MLSWITGAATVVVLLLCLQFTVGPRSGLSLRRALGSLLAGLFVALVVAGFVATLAVTATGLTLRSVSLRVVLSVVASEAYCIVFAAFVSRQGWHVSFRAAAAVLAPLDAAASWAGDALAGTRFESDPLDGALAAFSWVAPLVLALVLFPRRATRADVAGGA
jgi:hypothetical protein